jgi:hypothetical protein
MKKKMMMMIHPTVPSVSETSVAEIEGAHDGMNMNKVKNALAFCQTFSIGE